MYMRKKRKCVPFRGGNLECITFSRSCNFFTAKQSFIAQMTRFYMLMDVNLQMPKEIEE